MAEYSGQNLTRVMHDVSVFTLLSSEGPLTRAEIRRRTGYTKVTVLDITERLTALGLVTPMGRQESRTPGPRAVLYGVKGDRGVGIAAEISKNRVYVEIEDVAGVRRGAYTTPVREEEADSALFIEAIEEACARAGVSPRDVLATVIATSGGVDPETGSLISWDLPHWHRNLRADLSGLLNGEIELENEVNLRAIAERGHPAMSGYENFVYIALGSGVGAAIVTDGELWRGRNGLAGEIGYLPLSPLSRGGRNSRISQLLGGEGLVELARIHGLPEAQPSADAHEIIEALHKSPMAEAFFAELSGRVALVAGILQVVLDTDAIVLGGDLALIMGDRLPRAVSEEISALYHPLSVRAPEVCLARVTEDPVLQGTRELVRSRLRTEALTRAGYALEPSRVTALRNSLRSTPGVPEDV